MKNILVLCTGNSCRSQMAQGYLQQMAGDKAKVYSAGIDTHGVNPKAIKTMAEDGVDISHHTSNRIDEYRDVSFDIVLTVCDHAHENCPWFPGGAVRLHQNFEDPSKVEGTEEEIAQKFREARDKIKAYSKELIETHLS